MFQHTLRTLRGLLAVALILIGTAGARAQKGESCFGIQTGYTSTNNSAIAGIFYQYGFSNHLRVAPEIGCVFRHHDKDAFTADLNFHVPLRVAEGSAELYPLAGLNFSSWTRHHIPTADDSDDSSARTSRFGLNIGAGFELKASPSLKLKIEAKYNLISRYSSFVLGVGIGYVF